MNAHKPPLLLIIAALIVERRQLMREAYRLEALALALTRRQHEDDLCADFAREIDYRADDVLRTWTLADPDHVYDQENDQ